MKDLIKRFKIYTVLIQLCYHNLLFSIVEFVENVKFDLCLFEAKANDIKKSLIIF